MTDVAGVTSCPDCGVEYTPTVITDDRPGQVLEQTCPQCEATTLIGVLWYPDGHYEVIGKRAVKDTCVRCGADGEFTVVDNRDGIGKTYCDACLRPHHRAVYAEIEAASRQ